MNERLDPWLVFAVFAVLYGLTANPWLGIVDSPEFASLFALGGVAHAPGYPTVVMAYRAFAWLPIEPKWAASIVTGLYGAAGFAVMYLASRAWGASRLGAAVACLLVGVSAEVWLLHTIPEAFAVSHLLAAVILWLAAPTHRWAPSARVTALGFAAGVSLGAHHALVLLAPVGLWAVASHARAAARPIVTLLQGAAALASGLAVYVYCLFAKSPVGLGRVERAGDLVPLFFRTEYGAGGLVIGGERDPLGHLVLYVVESAADFAFVGALLAIVGVTVILRETEHPHRGGRLALLASCVLAGPVFVMLFDAPAQGPTFELVRKFHAISAIVATPLFAWGVDDVLRSAPARRRAGLFGVLVLLVALTSWVRVSRVNTSVLEDYLRNTLEHLPADAVLLTVGDHRTFGAEYLQEVERVRPDVLFVNPTMLGRPWLFERVAARAGVALPAPEDLPSGEKRLDLRGFIGAFVTSDRPVFVTHDLAPDVLAEFPKVPEGVAWRLLRPGEPEPRAADLVASTRAVFAEFEAHAAPPVYAQDPWGWSVFNTWTVLWRDLERRCREDEDPCAEEAARMLERYPDL